MSADTWSLPVAVADIPETGRRVDVVADAHTRDTVAKIVGVVALPRLEGEFELTRHGGDGVHVVGRVVATVAQNCVLTLEPLENEIEEEFDLIFMPPRVESSDDEAVEDFNSREEPPEMLRDSIVDLGAVATEFLILGIDPYPRKPGVVFEAPRKEDDEGTHPFAALAALKKGPAREGN